MICLSKVNIYCVIDPDGFYKDMIYAKTEIDPETGQEVIKPMRAEVAEGYRLILRTDERPHPHLREHAGFAGFIRPKWDDATETWVEDATADEIAAWEVEHPAPVVPEPEPSELDVLGGQVAQLALAGMKKDQVIDALGAQLVQTKLDVIALKSAQEGGV